MGTRLRSPVTGSAVNTTPATRASTIRCTTTAMPASPCSPRSLRYAAARRVSAERKQISTAWRSDAAPCTPSTVSY
jgi:hypothetical protein